MTLFIIVVKIFRPFPKKKEGKRCQTRRSKGKARSGRIDKRHGGKGRHFREWRAVAQVVAVAVEAVCLSRRKSTIPAITPKNNKLREPESGTADGRTSPTSPE